MLAPAERGYNGPFIAEFLGPRAARWAASRPTQVWKVIIRYAASGHSIKSPEQLSRVEGTTGCQAKDLVRELRAAFV